MTTLTALSGQPAISVRGLGKVYESYSTPLRRLSAQLFGMQGAAARRHVVFEDVNFDVYPGEAFGIIGRNGSGKSTLLQCICGTLQPTAGMVDVRGRVGALLELGAGFNPEFTGRENIRVSAALAGMSPRMLAEQMDNILSFADIGDYVDQPVKTYSSGMFVRLAFSVMAHSGPSVLIIDEALAVGDVFFTQKCMRFIRGFIDDGGALLFVSHDTASVVNLCRRGLMLFPNCAHKAVVGPAEELCKDYLSRIYEDPQRLESVARQRLTIGDAEALPLLATDVLHGAPPKKSIMHVSEFNRSAESFGQGGVKITDVYLTDGAGDRLVSLVGGEKVRLVIESQVLRATVHPAFGFMLKDRHGQYVVTEGSDAAFRDQLFLVPASTRMTAVFSFTVPVLASGEYTLNVAVAEGWGDDHVQQHWVHDALRVECVDSPVVHGLMAPLDSSIAIVIEGDATSMGEAPA